MVVWLISPFEKSHIRTQRFPILTGAIGFGPALVEYRVVVGFDGVPAQLGDFAFADSRAHVLHSSVTQSPAPLLRFDVVLGVDFGPEARAAEDLELLEVVFAEPVESLGLVEVVNKSPI